LIDQSIRLGRARQERKAGYEELPRHPAITLGNG
jgi:hypothetical protein